MSPCVKEHTTRNAKTSRTLVLAVLLVFLYSFSRYRLACNTTTTRHTHNIVVIVVVICPSSSDIWTSLRFLSLSLFLFCSLRLIVFCCVPFFFVALLLLFCLIVFSLFSFRVFFVWFCWPSLVSWDAVRSSVFIFRSFWTFQGVDQIKEIGKGRVRTIQKKKRRRRTCICYSNRPVCSYM